MNTIFLIGGPPCAGKSTLAKSLSKKLEIPWIATDTIRYFMQKIVRKDDYPNLFDTFDVSAADYYAKYSMEEMIRNQNLEGEDVWKGVLDFIEVNDTWDSYIIEGVAILPKQVKELKDKNNRIKAVFIIDDNAERINKVIHDRGLWAYPDQYPDYVKDLELEWIIKYNDWMKKEVKYYGLPLVQVSDYNDLLEDALKRLE